MNYFHEVQLYKELIMGMSCAFVTSILETTGLISIKIGILRLI
jgi:hypothetical protein